MWLLLFLIGAEATSNGVSIICDVDQSNLGSNQRTTKSNATMWWVTPPQFANNQYTLRTADPVSATGPTKYLPNQWLNIYVRTTNQDQQFNGLILYAVNSQNQKVGNWQVPFGAPYHVMETQPCVVHSNADPKNYLSVFKFQGPPVGTGTVTIKALVKFGLAFPNPTGMFFWPNNAHITLTEGAPVGQAWFEGEVGESCITVCTKRGLGCNLAAMQTQGNSPDLLAKVSPYTNCTGPIMPGCGSASPSVGQAGCFYHSDNCTQPAVETPWVRNDICANLTAFSAGCCRNNKDCCTYNNAAWCCSYGTQETPGSNPSNQYGPWGPLQKGAGFKGNCTPAGTPASLTTVPLPARTNPGSHAITCEATKNSVLDGRRICACSTDGKYVADSASSVGILTVLLLAPLIISF